MSAVQIEEAGRGSARLDQVEDLFGDLYGHMCNVGWQLPLVEGGEAMWRKSIETMLGRLGVVYVAVRDDRVVGFAHGMLRKTPSYQGGKTAGVITNIYVRPEERGTRLGEQLTGRLEQWFRGRGAEVCELQVVSGNENALGFWHHLGFADDYVQLRKELGS